MLCGFAINPCGTAWGQDQFPIRLVDVTGRTGIDFLHTDGSSGERYIVETLASGMAAFDYDNDGDTDLYFLNGMRNGSAYGQPFYHESIVSQRWGGRFTDVTEYAGVGDPGFGLGVAVADYDNDGYQDLYVSNFGVNVLYRNRGDGTFANASDEAAVAGGETVGAGVCFLDIEGDGDLDVYVANYVRFQFDQHRSLTVDGFPNTVGLRTLRPSRT
ncbi:MAG: VCBS repeat-containing protein [Pirellulaceae bacterium]